MKFFFGAPIQGHSTWGTHVEIYQAIIETIKNNGHTILSEHTTGHTRAESSQKLEHAIGPMPKEEYPRRVYVRNKMLEMIESPDLSGIVFEVSVPSLGTGVEIAHAYLRERLGLESVPILVLYKKDFWPNKLSTMVRGVPLDKFPHYDLQEYDDLSELKTRVQAFVDSVNNFI